MGNYYTLQNQEAEGDTNVYLKRSIILETSAVSEDTAEVFETNTGKLAKQEDGVTAYPTFDYIPIPEITALQDADIVVKRDSESLVSGNYRFSLYRSGFEVEPSSGIYKFHLVIKART